MLQVVPTVSLHDVEQQQRAADRPRFRARVARAGDDEVGSRHQVCDSVGEAERVHPRLRPGHRG
jgi:hypothetical protein